MSSASPSTTTCGVSHRWAARGLHTTTSSATASRFIQAGWKFLPSSTTCRDDRRALSATCQQRITSLEGRHEDRAQGSRSVKTVSVGICPDRMGLPRSATPRALAPASSSGSAGNTYVCDRLSLKKVTASHRAALTISPTAVPTAVRPTHYKSATALADNVQLGSEAPGAGLGEARRMPADVRGLQLVRPR
jgi:hypothetical protein